MSVPAWKGIIIHHTWSPDNPDKYDWQNIRKYHLSKGWYDVGYHWGLEYVEKKLMIYRGRPEYMQGAHCKGKNDETLGIAVVGNFDEKPPNDETINKLAQLCVTRKQKYPSIQYVHPHNQYSEKTCPGKMFPMNMLLEKITMYESSAKGVVDSTIGVGRI